MTNRRAFLQASACAAAVPLALGATSLPAVVSGVKPETLAYGFPITHGLVWSPPHILGLEGVNVVVSPHYALNRNMTAIRVTAKASSWLRELSRSPGDSICKLIEVPNTSLGQPAAMAKLRRMLDDVNGFLLVAEACTIHAMDWGTYE